MTITRPGSSARIGAIAVLLLLAALPGESRADSECPGKGSTGCWASACVFTPEALVEAMAEGYYGGSVDHTGNDRAP